MRRISPAWLVCLGLLALPAFSQDDGPQVVTEERDGTISMAADRDTLRLVVAQLQRYATRSIQMDDALDDMEVTLFLNNVTPIQALREIANSLTLTLDETGDVLRLTSEMAAGGDPNAGNGSQGVVNMGGDIGLYFLPLQNVTVADARDLRGFIEELLPQGSGWSLSDMPRRNGFVLKAPAAVYQKAAELCEKFDLPSAMETRVYKLKYYTGTGNYSFKRDGVGTIGSTTGEGGEDLDVQTDVSFNLNELLQTFLSGPNANLHILETESLVIATDFPRNLDRLEALLDQIDQRPRQVLLEVTILQLTLEDGHQLGVDFNTLDGIDFNSIFTGGGAQTIRSTDFSSLATNTSSVGNGTLLDDGFGSLSYSSPRDVTDQGLQIGFIKNKVGVFVDAVETISEVTVTANPKILALDRHRSEIHIGDRLGFKTSDIDVSNGSTTTQETIEFLDTGIKLTFTPLIADNGYVRLLLSPKRSSGLIDANGVPQEEVAELSVNAIVRSGHTLVIGGLMEEVTQNDVNQIPFLGDIPFIGWAFGRQSGSIRKEEIVFLITPYVINDEDMEEISMRVWAEMEERRQRFESHLWLGNRARRSYMWLGSDGDPRDTDSLARTEWALAINPMHPTALQVRDQILTRRGKPTLVETLEQNLDLYLHTQPGYWSERGGSYHTPTVLSPAQSQWNPQIWPEEEPAEDTETAPSDSTDVSANAAAPAVAEDVAAPIVRLPLRALEAPPWWDPNPSRLAAAQTAELALAITTNSGLDMALIPGGEFWMGSQEDELGRSTNEKLHKVSLSAPFYMAATEVTQDLWQRVTGSNPSNFEDAGLQAPVEQVSWFDAVDFCNQLSASENLTPRYQIDAPVRAADGRLESASVSLLEGNGYRLPTEAEWERACRADTRTPYWNGESLDASQACFNTGAEASSVVPVRSYAPNPFGLFDMHGNVAEWCGDWYMRNLEAAVSDPHGPDEGLKKVYRGGSYLVKDTHCRSAYREQFAPGSFFFYLGFRVVRDVPEEGR